MKAQRQISEKLDSIKTQHKVRLTGIDAPERCQPFGTVSRDHLASLVAGKDIRVESTKNDLDS
jgi:endonuclease YncB( thermonuclease family)